MSKKPSSLISRVTWSTGEGALTLVASIFAYAVVGYMCDFIYPPLSNVFGGIAFFAVIVLMVACNLTIATRQTGLHWSVKVTLVLAMIGIVITPLVFLPRGWGELVFVFCIVVTAFLRRTPLAFKPVQTPLRLVK